MKLATPRSPKFRRLMNLTGLSRAGAAGTLELLWLFTMEQAPAGDVGRWSDEDLETELDWMGEPGTLIEALVETRWLDRCAVHRLVVHDWADHMPEYLAKRVQRETLVLAVPTPSAAGGHRQPSADNGSHREEPSANGGIREEKPRHATPRETTPSGETAAAEPPQPPLDRVKRIRATRVPDQLSAEDRARVQAWAQRQDPPISTDELEYGWKTYLSRAKAKGYKYEDHARAFMNALSPPDERWALKGYKPPARVGGGMYSETPKQRRDREDRERERALAIAERAAARSDPDQDQAAQHVANVIDLSLRQAGGGA